MKNKCGHLRNFYVLSRMNGTSIQKKMLKNENIHEQQKKLIQVTIIVLMYQGLSNKEYYFFVRIYNLILCN